jgi:O-antigen ligase
MLNQKAEEILTRIITFGVLAVTIFVEPFKSSEPVNAPKMLVLSTVGISALFVVVTVRSYINWGRFKWILVSLIAFLSLSFASIIFSSDNPINGIYGAKGRSTGLVTYISLAVLLLVAALIQKKRTYDLIVRALLLAGVINLIYNFMFIAGFDPIPWSNPYGTILGFFGNPNFISSFLGIITSIFLAYCLSNEVSKPIRIVCVLAFPITIFQIVYSRSIQGLFVTAICSAVVILFYIRLKLRSKSIQIVYLSVVFVVGITSILGMLQKGPLASLVYKTSVSLRGEYWAAGINMGMSNPLTGIGLDSYGIWYRMFRRESAMVLPGPSVVSDSAHNVFIDFFASGGFPLLFAYLAIQILVIISIWKIAREIKSFSVTPVVLIASWIGYTCQSIISINQIGLAVWGWVLGGAIIGYSMLISEPAESSAKASRPSKTSKSKQTNRSEAAVSLTAIVGLLIGFLIALPPVRADMAWRSALKTGNAGSVEAAMNVWPMTNRTLNAGIVLFANNGLSEKALEYARIDVEQNKNNYVAWYTLYQLQGVSESERKGIFKKLHELDPLNPEYIKSP